MSFYWALTSWIESEVGDQRATTEIADGTCRRILFEKVNNDVSL